MNGTGKNATNSVILAGCPLSETGSGGFIPAGPGAPAMAFATESARGGGSVSYSSDATIERSDWLQIAGTRLLVAGRTYYLDPSNPGRIALNGVQPVARALSSTTIRVAISQLPAFSQVIPVSGQPASSVGSIGDFAFDASTASFYGPKTNAGWGHPARMVQTTVPSSLPIIMTPSPYGGWQLPGQNYTAS